jgi:hypothetical protein
VGNVLGVESVVSGTELMVGEQEREISTTKPETDATMSDIGVKAEEHNAHGRETSEVDTMEEVFNKEIKQEVTFRKVQITKSNVLSFDVNKERLGEMVVENKFPVDFSPSGISEMDKKEEENVNVTSFIARKRRIMVATGNRGIPEAVLPECVKEDRLYKKKVAEVGVSSSDRTEIGSEKFIFEDSASEPDNSGTRNTQTLSERSVIVRDNVVQEVVEIDRPREAEYVQETVPEKESHLDVRHKAKEQENVTVLHQEVAVADTQSIHLEEKGNEINEEKNEREKEAGPSSGAVYGDVVMQNGMSLIDVKCRTEVLIDEVTNEGPDKQRNNCDKTAEPLISEATSAEVKEQRYESVNSVVRKTVDISDSETVCNNDSETHVSKTDSEIETENFQSISIVYNPSHSYNDGSNSQITQHAQEVTQKNEKEFVSSVRNTMTGCSSADTGSVIAGEPTSSDTREIAEITSRSYSYGTVSNLSVTTINVSRGSGEQVCNPGNCEHRTVEYPFETVSKDANSMTKDEQCMLIGERPSRKEFGRENGRDIAGPIVSDSLKTTGYKSQTELRNYAFKDTDCVCLGTSSSAMVGGREVRISEISGEGDKFRTELEE